MDALNILPIQARHNDLITVPKINKIESFFFTVFPARKGKDILLDSLDNRRGTAGMDAA